VPMRDVRLRCQPRAESNRQTAGVRAARSHHDGLARATDRALLTRFSLRPPAVCRSQMSPTVRVLHSDATARLIGRLPARQSRNDIRQALLRDIKPSAHVHVCDFGPETGFASFALLQVAWGGGG
jgi:hypothetical protein